MPVYPASMSALPQPMLVPARWHPLRVTAAVLCFVALVMAVAALFVPLYSGEMSFGTALGSSPERLEMTFTPWDVEFSDPAMNAGPTEVPKVGYPMVFVVLFLACATAACWFAATPSAGRTAGRAAGVVTTAAAAFLIGTVWTIAVMVTNAIDSILMYNTLSDSINADASYLVGYWLLLAAGLLGLAAAIMALLPARQRVWQPPGSPYAPTPPYGFGPMAFGAMSPLPPAGPVAYAVDPLTGRPLPGPPVAPYASVDPLTGEPLSGRQPAAANPLTGQPSPPMGVPTALAQPNPPNGGAPHTMVDPLTGQPLPPRVDPVIGQPAAQIPGSPAPAVDPMTGQPAAQALPFTQEPVGSVTQPPVSPVNGVARTPELPPIQLPDPPPQPENPPGPAIPASEDPLAEPPRT